MRNKDRERTAPVTGWERPVPARVGAPVAPAPPPRLLTLPPARVTIRPPCPSSFTRLLERTRTGMAEPLVGVIMGSRSDWETMRHAVETLDALGVPHEVKVVSAHRTPDLLFDYAANAEGRGIQVIVAGAGGAAHLPGMAASKTVLPVLGVPVESKALKGMDSLLSIVQMPGGIPVGTLAIGPAGAVNAALLAASIVGSTRPEVREAVRRWREERTRAVLEDPDPRARRS